MMEKRLLLFSLLVVFLVASVSAECGDGICDANETEMTCPEDCDAGDGSVCGDGACSGLENEASCPEDCSAGGCGDGICDPDETAEGCPEDCDPDSLILNDTDCQNDTFTCPGGVVLYRDPALNCEFPACPTDPSQEPCVDFCGDGDCQYDESCQGEIGCPCLETSESCPTDCSEDVGGGSSGSGGYMKYIWIGLSIVGALLFIFIGLKILKWLFWMLALVMVVVAVLFWFVL